MSETKDNETEILLGNKQLLGIFFVVAFLLAVAFTGGYMVGRNSADKRTVLAATASPSPPGSSGSSLETHAVSPSGASDTSMEARQSATQSESRPPGEPSGEPPLGSPKHKAAKEPTPLEEPVTEQGYEPQPGQSFIQVAAVVHEDADAVADVLRKKGFRAHSVPKPGSAKLYRVLIGPIRDAADLSATREALRNTGFRDFILQKY